MTLKTKSNGKITRTLLATLITIAVLAFVGQVALAGPGCLSKDKTKSCGVKACEAVTTCTKTAKVEAKPTEVKTAEVKATCEKKCSKEECIAKCMAQGMTKEEAEACWAKHSQGHGEGLARTAAAGCPHAAKTATVQECSKKECIAKLMATGLSEKEAEAKYIACQAEGKCSGKPGTGHAACCATAGGKK